MWIENATILMALLFISTEGRAQSAADGFDPGANGALFAMAVQADGKILVRGFFTSLGGGIGTITRNRIGRLNADGPVTFNSAAVTAGMGTVSGSSGNGTAIITVNLTGITNAQRITLTLPGASNGTNTGDLSVPMGVLLGDTSANGTVNSTDVSQTKSKSGQAVDPSNFRTDVTVSNSINSTDVSLVKSKSGTALP